MHIYTDSYHVYTCTCIYPLTLVPRPCTSVPFLLAVALPNHMMTQPIPFPCFSPNYMYNVYTCIYFLLFQPHLHVYFLLFQLHPSPCFSPAYFLLFQPHLHVLPLVSALSTSSYFSPTYFLFQPHPLLLISAPPTFFCFSPTYFLLFQPCLLPPCLLGLLPVNYMYIHWHINNFNIGT